MEFSHLWSHNHPAQSPWEDPLIHCETAFMTQTNSWLLQTPVLSVLASPTTKAENKYINFYLSYRVIWIPSKSFFTYKVDPRYKSCKIQLFWGLSPWCPWVSKTEGEKEAKPKSKPTSHYFFSGLFFVSEDGNLFVSYSKPMQNQQHWVSSLC